MLTTASPGANLLVSMLFREVPQHPHELTQRVALAAAEACREIADVSPMLKWPNDLLLDGRKLAGVLAQAGGAGPAYVVVGIGKVNRNVALYASEKRERTVLADAVASLVPPGTVRANFELLLLGPDGEGDGGDYLDYGLSGTLNLSDKPGGS